MMNYLGSLLTGAQQYLTHRKSKGLGILAFILIFGLLIVWEDWFKPIMDFTGITDFAHAIGLVQSTAVMTFFVSYLLLAVVLYILCIVIFFIPLVQTIFLMLPQPIQIIIFAPVIIVGLFINYLLTVSGLKKKPVPEYSESEMQLRKMLSTLNYSGDTYPTLPIVSAADIDTHRYNEYQTLTKAEQTEFDKHDKYTYKPNGTILFMRNQSKALTLEQVEKRFRYASFVPHLPEHFVVAFHKERRLWAILTKLNYGLGENEVIYQLFLPEWMVQNQSYEILIDLKTHSYTNRQHVTGIASLDEFTDYHTFKGPQFEAALNHIGQWKMQEVIRQVQLEVTKQE